MNQGRHFGDSRSDIFGWAKSTKQNTDQEYFLTGMPNRQDFRIALEPQTPLLNKRFVIGELLHRGSYCDLYRAFDNGRGHVVALKVATVIPGGDEDIDKLIRNELALNCCITNYSHVLRIYDIHPGCYDGVNLLILSMEYADGGSLRQWLKDNARNLALRRSEGIKIFKQICRGLAELHDRDILHLDLKPENILIVDGAVKIADLGVSNLMYCAANEFQLHETNIWPKIGTPAYMSPEQLMATRPWDIDVRSDIYSAALILFEICHPQCRPLFSRRPESLRYKHQQTPAPEIADLDENISRVIFRGLKKDPAERYQTVSNLLLDLEGRLEEHPNDQVNQTVEQMWAEVIEYLQTQDFDGAMAMCNRILEIEPGHEEASVALTDLEERFRKARQFYSVIRSGMRKESLEHLIGLLIEALGIYPNHPDVQLVLMEMFSLCKEYREAMESALESADLDRWTGTVDEVRHALQSNPSSFVVRRALEHALRQARLQEDQDNSLGMP